MNERRPLTWFLVPVAAVLAVWSAWPTPTAWEVGGRVLHTDGRPVAGAVVRQMRDGPHPVATAWTDARGGFALRLIPGDSTVEIDAPGQAIRRDPLPWPMPAPDLQLGEFRLVPGRTARVIVTDQEGKPIPGLEVRADRHSAVTDTEGGCEFRRIAAGSHAVTLHSEGPARPYVASGSPLVVGEVGEPTEARVTVDVVHPIRGKVVDEEDKPVEDIRIITIPWILVSAYSGARGEFELTPGDDLPPKEVQLKTEVTETFESLVDPRRVRWGQEEVVLQLRKRPVGTLSLDVEVVSQATGSPVTGCKIYVWERPHTLVPDVTAAPHGKATITGLRSGWTEVQIAQDSPTLQAGATQWVELRTDRTNTLRVELAPREVREVQLLGHWPEASVAVVHTTQPGGSIPAHGAADEERAAAMLDLPPGQAFTKSVCTVDERGLATVPVGPGVREAALHFSFRPPVLAGVHYETIHLELASGRLQAEVPPPPGRLTGRILPAPEIAPALILRRPGVGPLVTRLHAVHYLMPDLRTRPDRFGCFHFDHVPAGDFELHPVTSPLGARPLACVRITSGAMTWVAVDGAPFRAGNVTGRVLLDGVPAAGRQVELVAGKSYYAESRTAETDAAGWFTTTALPGEYVLNLPYLEPGRIWRPAWHGVALARATCRVRSGETTCEEFALETQSLALTVRWQDGAPVAIHNAVMLFQEHGLPAIQSLDDEASSTFALAPWAPFGLTVVTDDGAVPLGTFQLAAGQRHTRLDLTLPRPRPPWLR